MAKALFTVRLGTVLRGIRAKSEAARAYANEAAVRIAERANTVLIPSLYPGKVAQAIVAVPEPSVRGGTLLAVRTFKAGETNLFFWYEFGTKDGPTIYPIYASALFFYWKKIGEDVVFAHVEHKGYAGRHKLPIYREELRVIAYEEWSAALRRAMEL